jgi:hypothetical protein
LRPDPAQRPRLAEIRDNLHARIAEATREGWHGEIEGLQVSLAGANSKIAQIDAASHRTATNLGMPAFSQITARAGTARPATTPQPSAAPAPSQPNPGHDQARHTGRRP